MARIQFIDPEGRTTPAHEAPELVQGQLQTLGIESGQWQLPARPVSTLPHLNHARELLALQRRFGHARVERLRLRVLRPGQATGLEPGPASAAEPAGPHAREQRELRVVLAGRLHYLLRAPSSAWWVTLRVDAGDWVALPPGLPHTVTAAGDPGLDLLRLHLQAGPPHRPAWAHREPVLPREPLAA